MTEGNISLSLASFGLGSHGFNLHLWPFQTHRQLRVRLWGSGRRLGLVSVNHEPSRRDRTPARVGAGAEASATAPARVAVPRWQPWLCTLAVTEIVIQPERPSNEQTGLHSRDTSCSVWHCHPGWSRSACARLGRARARTPDLCRRCWHSPRLNLRWNRDLDRNCFSATLQWADIHVIQDVQPDTAILPMGREVGPGQLPLIYGRGMITSPRTEGWRQQGSNWCLFSCTCGLADVKFFDKNTLEKAGEGQAKTFYKLPNYVFWTATNNNNNNNKVATWSCLRQKKQYRYAISKKKSQSAPSSVYSQSETRLPSPAPPPKSHYSTFWRSVGKRIYILHMEEIMQSAKALSPKLRNKLQWMIWNVLSFGGWDFETLVSPSSFVLIRHCSLLTWKPGAACSEFEACLGQMIVWRRGEIQAALPFNLSTWTLCAAMMLPRIRRFCRAPYDSWKEELKCKEERKRSWNARRSVEFPIIPLWNMLSFFLSYFLCWGDYNCTPLCLISVPIRTINLT